MKVKFYFFFNNKEWYWIKNFKGVSSNDELLKRIESYLELKELPFEIKKEEVKYKII